MQRPDQFSGETGPAEHAALRIARTHALSKTLSFLHDADNETAVALFKKRLQMRTCFPGDGLPHREAVHIETLLELFDVTRHFPKTPPEKPDEIYTLYTRLKEIDRQFFDRYYLAQAGKDPNEKPKTNLERLAQDCTALAREYHFALSLLFNNPVMWGLKPAISGGSDLKFFTPISKGNSNEPAASSEPAFHADSRQKEPKKLLSQRYFGEAPPESEARLKQFVISVERNIASMKDFQVEWRDFARGFEKRGDHPFSNPNAFQISDICLRKHALAGLKSNGRHPRAWDVYASPEALFQVVAGDTSVHVQEQILECVQFSHTLYENGHAKTQRLQKSLTNGLAGDIAKLMVRMHQREKYLGMAVAQFEKSAQAAQPEAFIHH